MLRKENKYMLGTIAECAKELYKADEKRFENRFVNCDFAIADSHVDVGDDLDFEHDDLETIFENSSGWYGINKLDTGFDNSHDDDVDLFADYYGGGCGVYNVIYEGMEKNECIKIVKELIMSTLNMVECCKEDTLLIGIVKE